MPTKDGTNFIDRAIAAMRIGTSNEHRAREQIIKNIDLMQGLLDREPSQRTPKETSKDLRALSEAANTISKAQPVAAHLLRALADVHGLSFPSDKMAMLAAALERQANSIVQPKGAQRPRGPSPRAKGLAVLAAVAVIRGTLPELDPFHYDELIKRVGLSRFKGLAEVLFEAITRSSGDCVGQLDHQIRMYRKDKLDLDQGMNITLRVGPGL